jgi:hypothetical protein
VFDADGPEIKLCKLATLQLLAEARAIYWEGKFAEAVRLFWECGGQNQGAIALLKFIGNAVSLHWRVAPKLNTDRTI